MSEALWEQYNLGGKYLRSREGVTNFKHAFLNALFNSEVVIGQYGNNEKIVRKSLEKINQEEKIKKYIEGELIKFNQFDSLRKCCRYIHDKPKTFFIINYNKKWYVRDITGYYLKTHEVNSYTGIDNKSCIYDRLGVNDSTKIDTVTHNIKYTRDNNRLSFFECLKEVK